MSLPVTVQVWWRAAQLYRPERRAWRASLPLEPTQMCCASSSLGIVAAAIGPGPLGFDIEHRSRWPLAAEALGIPDPERAIRGWTRYEALMKALGPGLARGWDRELARQLADCAAITLNQQRWETALWNESEVIGAVVHTQPIIVASTPWTDARSTAIEG